MKRKLFPLVLFCGLLSMAACKKEVNGPGDILDPEVPVVLALEDSLKDSIFYYTKLLSLWQDYLPPRNINDMLQPGVIRSYTSAYTKGEEVLEWLKGLSPIDDITKKPVDRFSFLDRAGSVSSEIQDGVSTSFGMFVFYLSTASTGTNADLYVRMVDTNSPAYKAGIRRGDRILSIDGKTNIDYNTQQAQNFQGINTALNASRLVIEFVKPDGSIVKKDIASTQYDLDPILRAELLPVDNKKIGYLAFSSFVNITTSSGQPSDMRRRFDEVFADFQSSGIQELVVDLRYNGGGSVNTAEYLADHIVPASANQQLMYTYEVNSILEGWGWKEQGESFAPVFFSKKGHLALSKVYFLVTSASASASELLINSLKPYMSVYMVGTYSVNAQNQQVAERTYGKPVGFFGIPVMEQYATPEIFVSSFKMYNKDGEGDYFGGMLPQAHVWEYSKFSDFGALDEPMLAAALGHIQQGTFASANSRLAVATNGVIKTNRARSATLHVGGFQKNNMFKFSGEVPRLK